MTTPASTHRRAPSFVTLLNPLISRLIGAGLPFGPNVLLTVRGRTSGQPRTVPVAVLRHEGRRFVQSPFGDVHWTRNLRAAGTAVITTGRRREDVTARQLSPEEAGQVLHAAFGPYLRSRIGAAYIGHYFGVRRESTLDDFVATAREHPVFELQPSPAS